MLSAPQERRISPRFPFTLDVEVRTLLQVPFPYKWSQPQIVHGRLQNLSKDGACILTEEDLDEDVVVCELAIPELPVPIPVLMNKRWSEPRAWNGGGHLYGFQFLY